MMRKEIEITINEDNRDAGKSFLIREMSALQAERWAIRALGAVARSGMDVPEAVGVSNLQTVAFMGLQALLKSDYDELEPLLQELLDCVLIKQTAIIRKLTSDDVEEVSTLLLLKWEAFKLNTAFFTDGSLSKSTSGAMSSTGSSNTGMSPDSSGSSFPQAKPH